MNLRKEFSDAEWKFFIQASDAWGALAVLTDWGMIAASFALCFYFPNPLTYFIAMAIIGGRQLALAILVHDCSHYSLFKTRGLNNFIGKWFCGAPIWQSLYRYRVHHLKHHQWAGSTQDPDFSLVSPFPIPAKSLFRKFFRDLTGISGIKRIFGLVQMDFDFLTYTAAADPKKIPKETRSASWFSNGLKRIFPVIAWQIFLIFIFKLLSAVELYFVWLGAYFIFFSLFVRIRSIAEHACLELDLDPFKSTRTTLASFIARITVAPHRVNYHLEHHLLMTVPHHRLPALHRFLNNKGLLNEAEIANGYFQVLRRAMII